MSRSSAETFPKILEEAHQRFHTSVVTNGWLLRNRIRDIAPHLDMIFVSLDGIGELHDRLRGIPGSFDKAVEGIRSARGRVPVAISSTITNENMDDAEKVVALAQRLGVGVTFQVAYKYSTAENLTPAGQKLRETLERLLALKEAGAPILESREVLHERHQLLVPGDALALQAVDDDERRPPGTPRPPLLHSSRVWGHGLCVGRGRPKALEYVRLGPVRTVQQMRLGLLSRAVPLQLHEPHDGPREDPRPDRGVPRLPNGDGTAGRAARSRVESTHGLPTHTACRIRGDRRPTPSGHTTVLRDSNVPRRAVAAKRYSVQARVSTENPAGVTLALGQFFPDGSISPTDQPKELLVTGRANGESARNLNRSLLSALRRVEKRTRLRSEWTYEGSTERFFDYVPKGKRKSSVDPSARA